MLESEIIILHCSLPPTWSRTNSQVRRGFPCIHQVFDGSKIKRFSGIGYPARRHVVDLIARIIWGLGTRDEV